MTVTLPEETRIESVMNETAYHTLTVFDGRAVRDIFIPLGHRKVEINVHRGSLILLMLKPPEGYAPLVSWYEPGHAGPTCFTYGGMGLFDALLSAAAERPSIVRNLSLDAVRDAWPDLDGISPWKFVSCLEKGSLSRTSPVQRDRCEVVLESLVRGTWISDRGDTGPLHVEKSGEPVRLDLYPGEYRFLLPERGMMLRLCVEDGGKASSSLSLMPKWS